MSTHSITNANEAKLIQMVESARRRLLLLAPGVSDALSKSVCQSWERLGAQAVTVILDVDPEVCRLGYGTLVGLKLLQQTASRQGALVCHQPGVRIGLLVVDDTTLIFSPTPLLIEAGSSQPERPNAILLGELPTNVASDMGLGANPDRDRIVGLDRVPQSKIDSVARDLTECPPMKFDLARRVRVFTSRFQFVEFEMTGCFVSRKKVTIPSSLMGLASDPEIQSQFHAQYNLVQRGALKVEVTDGGGKKRILTEDSLRHAKKRIADSKLISLTGYGSVVLRANKEKLIAEVEQLKQDVAEFQKGVESKLQEQMDESAKVLVDALLPAIKRTPPDDYTKFHGPGISEDAIKSLLEMDIRDAFGQAVDLVAGMDVRLVFKDMAYESLSDEKFLGVAHKAIPDFDKMHEEYDVAEGVPQNKSLS